MAEQLDRLMQGLGGRYRVQREIGRGGMAVVYLADDVKHERPVALKVLRSDLSLGAGRFLREIGIAARLRHPNILPLYDSGEVEGCLYYVMPYIDGESLRERLDREGALPIEQAVRIAREVADALAAAHRQGVVHRDIKPENVLLDQGHAVVADFGIARAVTEAGQHTLTKTGIAVGTPTYMSPEQLQQSDELDGRSDLYSLGCVLYEMLTGRPPFTGDTAWTIMAGHAFAAPPPLAGTRTQVPDAIASVIQRALAKRPEDRFSTGEQFAAALTRPDETPALSLPSPAAVTSGPRLSLRGMSRRRRWRAGLPYLVTVLASLAAAVTVISRLGLPRTAGIALGVVAFLGIPVLWALVWRRDLGALAQTAPWRVLTQGTRGVSTTPSGRARATRDAATSVAGRRLAPSKRVVRLLTTRAGLSFVIAVVFLLNLLETTAETALGSGRATLAAIRHHSAQAMHWLEGRYMFVNHDVTGDLATFGYSAVYFFVFPTLVAAVAIAFARRRSLVPFRLLVVASTIDYLISLPFFLFFPVPERWTHADSGAVLLSDRWTSQLIEAFRPISGLDNCFPSFHVSLTVIVVILSFVCTLRYRWTVLFVGTTVFLSTFVLGIHWLGDIAAGIAAGTVSAAVALRFEGTMAALEQRPASWGSA